MTLAELAPTEGVSQAYDEMAARRDLAAAYRLTAHFRMTDTIYTHISARVPGENAFLINAFGLHFEEITASNLVKVREDGSILDDPTGLGINAAGFIIHSEIHMARHDVDCVFHTHTAAGIGVAAQKQGLLPISQHASAIYHELAYHSFEGIVTSDDERVRLRNDIGDKSVLILRNHGLLTAGASVADAFVLMLTLERACQAQIAAMAGGAELNFVTQEALEATERRARQIGKGRKRDWESLLRLAERISPGFDR